MTVLIAGCDRGRRENVEPGDETVARTYENARPEGVSSTNDPVTTTLFIEQAAIGDLYEIEAASVAMGRTRDARVRTFAEMMLKDHRRTLDALKAFVADHPVNRAVPDNIDARRTAMMQNLRDATDAEFDHEYLGQQAAAHDEALNLHKSFATRGDYPALQKQAAATAERIEAHRRMLGMLGTGAPVKAQGTR